MTITKTAEEQHSNPRKQMLVVPKARPEPVSKSAARVAIKPAKLAWVEITHLLHEGPLGIIEHIKEGLPYLTIEAIAQKSGMTVYELGEYIGVPKTTLLRRKSDNTFNAVESERLVRFANAIAKAEDVFDDNEAAARQWLSTPALALGGRVPFDLLDTDIGAQEVQRLLVRIDHGVYA